MSGWRALGVDACKTGWIGISLSEGMVSAHAAAGIYDLFEEASSGSPLAVIAVDIPIGLPGRQGYSLLVTGSRPGLGTAHPLRPAAVSRERPEDLA
jgi:predicted RNase H-like nuclease